jgi:glycosyltransferase involved in cell wall biosynthesis
VESTASQPLVSVVTPFHNTAAYLAECIESVLAQNYSAFEYILVDNCSTDGSGEIAEEFARRDPRIRLIRRSALLTQVQNYNGALHEISNASRYCKIVQADDFIFPECLDLMVKVLERYESVGLVSSYWLKGSELRGSGFPFPTAKLAGKEMARRYLRTGLWVFGSPTAVMYRSSLIKKGEPFYDESQLHEDTDKCLKILKEWDFGFVHQVLSFSRAGNESISSAVRSHDPYALDRYINVKRYAAAFLEEDEAAALLKNSKRLYYRALAHHSLRFRGGKFWRYHQNGLSTMGEGVDWFYLALEIVREVLWKAANPGTTLHDIARLMSRRSPKKNAAENSLAYVEKSAAPGAGATPPSNAS